MEMRYFPLIDGDDSGMEKVPMFFTTDEDTVRKNHKMYLTEINRTYYRLKSVNAIPKGQRYFFIHCPLCGNVMNTISAPQDSFTLAIYHCQNCKY